MKVVLSWEKQLVTLVSIKFGAFSLDTKMKLTWAWESGKYCYILFGEYMQWGVGSIHIAFNGSIKWISAIENFKRTITLKGQNGIKRWQPAQPKVARSPGRRPLRLALGWRGSPARWSQARIPAEIERVESGRRSLASAPSGPPRTPLFTSRYLTPETKEREGGRELLRETPRAESALL